MFKTIGPCYVGFVQLGGMRGAPQHQPKNISYLLRLSILRYGPAAENSNTGDNR